MHAVVEQTKARSEWPARRTLRALGIPPSSYYRWLREEAWAKAAQDVAPPRPAQAYEALEEEQQAAELSEKQKWDRYAEIVRAAGGEVNPQGWPTVLGIRGMNRRGEIHRTTFSLAMPPLRVLSQSWMDCVRSF